MKKYQLAAAIPGSLLAASLCLAQAHSPGEHISFVACPILQDTDLVPCWVTEYAGEKYFLGIQTDIGGWSAPYLKHKVLVEGTVADMPRVCGGIVLESSSTPFVKPTSGTVNGKALPNPPVTSPLRDLDLNCSTILPVNPVYNTFEPRRGPGPSVGRLPPTPKEQAERAARAEATRLANIVEPPFKPRTFRLNYEFDAEIAGLTINELNNVVRYAQQINASRIKITAYRSSSLLSDGTYLTEKDYMARIRATELGTTISQLDIPTNAKLEVTWSDEVIKGDGIDDWEGRIADIEVIP